MPFRGDQVVEAFQLGRRRRLIRGGRVEEGLLEVTPFRFVAMRNRSWSVALDPSGALLFILGRRVRRRRQSEMSSGHRPIYGARARSDARKNCSFIIVSRGGSRAGASRFAPVGSQWPDEEMCPARGRRAASWPSLLPTFRRSNTAGGPAVDHSGWGACARGAGCRSPRCRRAGREILDAPARGSRGTRGRTEGPRAGTRRIG